MPADHLIKDAEALKTAVDHAVELAGQGYLVTFGIRPTAPETGFGYIEAGAPVDERGASIVKRFVEKPDLQTAEGYVSSGRFSWNSGMFCFTVATLIEELQEHAPELLQQATACVAASPASEQGKVLQQELASEYFAALPDISIDYALMERSSRVAVVPASFGWSDIGSWEALRTLITPDGNDNRAVGDAIFVDSYNTFVHKL